MTAQSRLCVALATILLASSVAACGEDPPPPPPPESVLPAESFEPEPEVPEVSPCDRLCDRVMACDLGELGDRFACMRRCRMRAPRDITMLNCLAEPTPDGQRRCDLARRCVSVVVDRAARPEMIVAEHDRFDGRGLGPDVQITLEARLVNANPDASRYELALLLRGRGQWDGGIADEDAGFPFDGGVFDGGLEAPDVWLRVGPYSSDGRLPLIRIDPRPTSDDPEAPLFQHGSYWARTGDYYRVRHVRDELIVEHAFSQTGHTRSEELRSGFEPTLRVLLAPGTRVTALRQLVE